MINYNRIKLVFIVALITIGLLLIINASILAMVSNFNFGIIITLGFGVLLSLYGIYFDKINASTSKGILKWVKYIIYAMFAFALCIITYITIFGQFDTARYNEDAIIVLGAGIRGENVTLTLAYRLDEALEYINNNPNAIIVVSGGQGPQEEITEAVAMERYLNSRGVPKEKIFKEEKATSTYENFVFSKKLLDYYFKGPYNTVFITNDFHIYRASRLAKIAGLKSAHIKAKIEWYTVSVNYLREFTAVLKFWILRR